MAGKQEDAGNALLPRVEENTEGESQGEEVEPSQSLQQVEQAPQYSLCEQLAAWREETNRRQEEMANRQLEMMSLFAHQLQHLPGELKAIMETKMDVLEAKVITYTEETCTRVKEEVKEETKVVKKEMREEMKACLDKVATLERVLAPNQESAPAALADPMVGWGRGHRVVEASSLPALHAAGITSPPPSPPHSPSPTPSVVCCHDTPRDEGRPAGRFGGERENGRHFSGPWGGERSGYEKKVIEYDGKVSWDAYQAQYEAIAFRQNWSRAEKAFQLVSSLKGQALEVLEHLTPAQLQCYDSVAGALRRRFGRRRQPEVFRAQLKTRKRGKNESLPMLAQDVESLVRGAYPMASEDTVDMLAKDCFVDALQDRQLQIHVKQAAPNNVQEALARAAEFEAFLVTTNPAPTSTSSNTSGWRGHQNRTWARRAQPAGKPSQPNKKASYTPFKGACFNCGQIGHKKHECKARARSWEEGKRMVFEPCCWSCGMQGHKSPECRQPKEVVSMTSPGNVKQLGAGAASQQGAGEPQNN